MRQLSLKTILLAVFLAAIVSMLVSNRLAFETTDPPPQSVLDKLDMRAGSINGTLQLDELISTLGLAKYMPYLHKCSRDSVGMSASSRTYYLADGFEMTVSVYFDHRVILELVTPLHPNGRLWIMADISADHPRYLNAQK